MIYSQSILVLILGIFLSGCSRSSREEPSARDSEIRERMTNANQLLVRDESKEIEDFIVRHQFRMTSTGTGLRFELLKDGTGPVPMAHQEVVVSYQVYLLDGIKVYDVSDEDPVVFRLQEGNEIKGVEEAVMMMKEGSSARLLIPSHLAYGMLGDQQKIRGATPLYLTIKLLKVNP